MTASPGEPAGNIDMNKWLATNLLAIDRVGVTLKWQRVRQI